MAANLGVKHGALLPYVTHKQLQDAVIKWATLRGWRHYHTQDSRKSVAGFPDLTMVRLSRVIFAEIKTERAKATPTQQEWLDELEGTGKVETYLWKPSDFDRIVEILR